MESVSENKLELKTSKHFLSYPSVKEFVNLVTYFEWTKIIVNTISNALLSSLIFLSKYEIIVSYWNYFDSTFDYWLNSFDNRFPIFKKFSFNSILNFLKDYYNSLISSIKNRYSSLSKSLQPRVNSIIKSCDPVLKVSNDYYEYVLNLILPDSTKITAESKIDKVAETTEYDRMLDLLSQTYSRIHLTASNVSKLPSHVSTTYHNELKETKSTTQAVSKTTRKLSNDAYNSIKPTIEKVVGLTSSTTDKITEPLIDVTEKIASNVAAATGVEVH
jgi:hypothetical protein